MFGGRMQEITTRSRAAEQAPTGHAGGEYEASCAAAMTSQGCPPTLTLLSAAVVERPWPCSVRVCPGWAEVVEIAVSTWKEPEVAGWAVAGWVRAAAGLVHAAWAGLDAYCCRQGRMWVQAWVQVGAGWGAYVCRLGSDWWRRCSRES